MDAEKIEIIEMQDINPKDVQESVKENIQETVQETVQDTVQETVQEIVQEPVQETVQENIQENIQETETEKQMKDQDWRNRCKESLKESFEKIRQKIPNEDVENGQYDQAISIQGLKDYIKNNDIDMNKEFGDFYITYSDLLELAEQADKNDDGKVEESEFLDYVMYGKINKTKLGILFDKLCEEGEKTIDVKKLMSKLETIVQEKIDEMEKKSETEQTSPEEAKFDINTLKVEDFKEILLNADVNGDGKIDRIEFMNSAFARVLVLTKNETEIWWHALKVIAYAEIYKFWPLPKFIPLMIILQIILYYCAMPIIREVSFSSTTKTEFWRFFTYSFFHNIENPWHLWMNMAGMFVIGIPLEMTNGSFIVSLIYFLGVLGSSLAFGVLDPGAGLVGASGGIFALSTAHIASIILNYNEDIVIIRTRWRSIQWKIFGYQINTEIKLPKASTVGKFIRLLRLFVVVGFILFPQIYLTLTNQMHQDTSVVAHAAGAIVGILAGILIIRNRKIVQWEIYLWWTSLVLLILLFLGFSHAIAAQCNCKNRQ